MDALDLLTRDHRDADDLFARLAIADDDEMKSELFERLAQLLGIHAAIEEQHFYPALRDASTGAFVERFRGEHDEVKQILAELSRIDPSDEEFDARLETLQRSVEAHVAEEERRLFPRVREVFTATELDDLGAELRAAKSALAEAEPSELVAEEELASPP